MRLTNFEQAFLRRVFCPTCLQLLQTI